MKETYYTHICLKCNIRSGSSKNVLRELTIKLCPNCTSLNKIKKHRVRNTSGVAKPTGRPSNKNIPDSLHVALIDDHVRIGMFINLPSNVLTTSE